MVYPELLKDMTHTLKCFNKRDTEIATMLGCYPSFRLGRPEQFAVSARPRESR